MYRRLTGRIFHSRIAAAAFLSAVTTALLAGAVYASIPGPSGVINGCYQKSSGKLRVIDSAATCNPSEVALNWNQTGPAGAPGPAGPAGPPGPPGPPGPGHFQQLTFTIAPGGSQSFALPAKQVPIRIEISFSLQNGGTQTPSEIMYAVVNQDSSSGQVSWVGTNNDGTQSGSSSLTSTDIAHIYGGASPTVNATLAVDNLGTGTLKLTQNANTTSIAGHYVVDLWF